MVTALEQKHTEEAKKEQIDRAENAIREMKRQGEEHQRSLDDAISKERQYRETVSKLTSDIADEKVSAEDRIRAIRRKSMTDAEQQSDIEEQVAQKIIAAKKALIAGDTERAEGLARQAQQISEGLENEEKAIAGIRAGSQLVIEAKQKEITAAQEAAQAQVDAQNRSISAMTMLAESIGKATEELNALKDPREIQLKADIAQAESSIAALQAKLAALKDKTVTVTMRTVEAKQGGGVVGLARGGQLSGFGGGDIVPAMLEPGEFVVRKDRARLFANLLHAINYGNTQALASLPRFATGGIVGGGTQSSIDTGGIVRFDWTLPTGRGSLRGSTAEVNALARALADLNRGVSYG